MPPAFKRSSKEQLKLSSSRAVDDSQRPILERKSFALSHISWTDRGTFQKPSGFGNLIIPHPLLLGTMAMPSIVVVDPLLVKTLQDSQ
jgi:hypothetical protein